MTRKRAGRHRNLNGDPGLEPTRLRSPSGPYVGTPVKRPPRRLGRSAAFDRLLLELRRGFGPLHWWPAQTPFEVLIGAVLTQNTAWRNVELALGELRKHKALTPASILNAREDQLESWVRSSGYYRAKAKKLRGLCEWYLESGGLSQMKSRALEPLRDELLGIWGIGPETADSMLCYAAGRRTPVVDTYTRRVLGRHGLIEEGWSYEQLRAWLLENLVNSQAAYEEFHALMVRAGNLHCGPNPSCETCPATTPEQA